MKYTLLCCAVIAMGISGYSQDQLDYSEKANEINIGYFNALDLTGMDEMGIGYKRLTNKGAIRISSGFNFWKDKSENDGSHWNSGGYEFSPKLGYEFHQWFNRFRVHYGADLKTQFIRFSSEDITEDPVDSRSNTSRTFFYGVRPFLGLTLFINSSISFATETYLDLSLYNSHDERTYGNETTIEKQSGMNMGLGPIGILSVNFHF